MGLNDAQEMLDACRDHATELEMELADAHATIRAIRAYATPSAEAGIPWAVMTLSILDGGT